ncbi:MAG: hypothetical protein WBC59_10490, partial [Phycisphaerae bacterium]
MDEPKKRSTKIFLAVPIVGGLLVALLIAFAGGYLVRWGCAPVPTGTQQAATPQEEQAEEGPTVWTCSMHP